MTLVVGTTCYIARCGISSLFFGQTPQPDAIFRTWCVGFMVFMIVFRRFFGYGKEETTCVACYSV